jgi:hypothetical protein
MKKTLTFIVLVALLVNCTYTLPHYLDYERKRPIMISARVGETIDREEQNQFGLFAGIEDFKAATFYEIAAGGYEVEITAGDKNLVAVNRDSQAVMILSDYINRYEEITDSRAAFEEKWKIIDYDTLGQPITLVEINNIKKNFYSCGCAGGNFLVGLIPNALFSFLLVGGLEVGMFSDTEFPRPLPAWISFIGINILSTVAGAMIGNKIDKRNAINSIREARAPRVVD